MPTQNTQKLIERLKKSDLKVIYPESEAKIQVDVFVSRIANIYEKIRNAIDYKEDHLLRKSAIFRILQRRMVIKVSIEDLAPALVKELIRAGYLENNLIPVAKVAEINGIIDKYVTLFNLSGASRNGGGGSRVFRWLLEICSCEIEEALVPPLSSKALVEFTYQVIRPKISIIDRSLTDKQKDLQVYLAINRALVKSDEAMMDFLLLKYYVPDWKTADKVKLMQIAKKILNLKAEIEKQKRHYVSDRLFRMIKKYTFAFFVLRDIILNEPDKAEEIFAKPEELEMKIREVCQKSYQASKTKIRRSIIRVTIYIFLTKMLLILLLELPYDKYIAHSVNNTALAINALFPPLLIFILGMFIKLPSKKNTERVVKLDQEIIYQGRISDAIKGFGINIKRRGIFNFIFNVLYWALFAFSFCVFITILNRLNFNIFSMAIFLLFLSIVSFFGIKMRLKARELIVVDRKENPLVFLINLFTLPFLRTGHWISEKFSQINVFVFILDFIIEAPFKIFLEVIEDWIAFLREKKEEIYNRQ